MVGEGMRGDMGTGVEGVDGEGEGEGMVGAAVVGIEVAVAAAAGSEVVGGDGETDRSCSTCS